MFGVDFSELVVIFVVALLVVGPERLPKVARTLGHLWGRAQRYINGVKADILREMAAEEFRQLQQKIQQEVMGAEQAANQVARALDQQVQQINSAVAQPAAQAAAQPASSPSQQAQSKPQSAAEQEDSPVI